MGLGSFGNIRLVELEGLILSLSVLGRYRHRIGDSELCRPNWHRIEVLGLRSWHHRKRYQSDWLPVILQNINILANLMTIIVVLLAVHDLLFLTIRRDGPQLGLIGFAETQNLVLTL